MIEAVGVGLLLITGSLYGWQYVYVLRLNQKLDQSDALFQKFFDLSLIALATYKPWIKVSDRLCEMMGYLRSEIMELNWEILDYPDDLSANFKLFEGAASGTESTAYTMDRSGLAFLNNRDWLYKWTPTLVMLPPLLATVH